MGNRTSKKTKINSKDKAILELKVARDKLKKYTKKLDVEKTVLQEQARKLLVHGQKDRAKLMLRLKKHKQNHIDKANEQLLRVMEMVDTVEWETQQLQVFEGLKSGNRILEIIHKEMSVEAVEDLMEETEESQATANEISAMLSGQLSAEDDDEVLLELAEIEQMQADMVGLDMPKVPTTEVPARKQSNSDLPQLSATELPEAPTSDLPPVQATKSKVAAKV